MEGLSPVVSQAFIRPVARFMMRQSAIHAQLALATTMGITGFMGFSLSLLASLKLMDIESFAKGFEKYDLITKRIRPYAKIYPFAKLAIALGFRSGVAPLATGITVISNRNQTNCFSCRTDRKAPDYMRASPSYEVCSRSGTSRQFRRAYAQIVVFDDLPASLAARREPPQRTGFATQLRAL